MQLLSMVIGYSGFVACHGRCQWHGMDIKTFLVDA